MNRILVGMMMLSCALLGACGDDDDSAGGGSSLCDKYSAVMAELNCAAGQSDCGERAQELSDGARARGCESQYQALVACTVSQPSANFMCTSGVGVALKQTACQSENEAYVTCYAKSSSN